MQDTERIFGLAFIAVVAYQVSILLQGALNISLPSGNLGESRGNLVLMGGGLLHLAQDRLHLLLFACASIGPGKQQRYLHFGSLVLFTFLAWTSRPNAGIDGTGRAGTYILERLLKLLD